VAIVLALAASDPRVAHADQVQTCIQADADAQRMRAQAHPVEALAATKTCASDARPRLIREECARWANEIAATIPRIRLLAIDAEGRPPARVSAVIDGVAQADFATGKPLSMDPGTHVVRLESEGLNPVEQVVEVSTTDRDRVLTLRFDGPSAPLAAFQPVPNERASRGEPSSFYVFGILAGAGLLAFAGLGTAGVVEFESMKGSCGSNCNPGRVSTDHALLVGADVSLVVALVTAGAAAVSHFVGSF